MNYKLFGAAIYILLACTSCKKESINNSDCRGNICKSVELSGKVVNASTNSGIKNIVVKAHFYQWKSTCIFCLGDPIETFATTYTDNGGFFKFKIVIDPNLLDQNHHYELNIYAATPNNYLSGNTKTFDKYRESFSNLILTKYQKSRLNITFKRNFIDSFYNYLSYFNIKDSINNEIVDPLNNPFFIKSFSSILPDTTVEIITGENVYTKIIGRKHSYNSVISEKVDSVFCTGTLNSITIKY